jgi:hypothetical protein
MTRSFFLTACLWLATFAGIDASAASLLYATDAEARELFVLSPTDGSGSLVGSFGISGVMADLAYDAVGDVLYGTTTDTDNLYTINRTTGAAMLIGPLGQSFMHSVAYDDVNRILYGVSFAVSGTSATESSLYRISTSTGQATLIGSVGISPGTDDEVIAGLAFNPADRFLYGSSVFGEAGVFGEADEGGIYRIDPNTGHGTFLFSSLQLMDLAFHPETGVLYGIDNGLGFRPDSLHTVDLATGTTTQIGLTGLGNNLGLEFAPVIPEPGSLALLITSGSWLLFVRLRRPRGTNFRILSVAVLLSAIGLHAEPIVGVTASTLVPAGGASDIAHIVDGSGLFDPSTLLPAYTTGALHGRAFADSTFVSGGAVPVTSGSITFDLGGLYALDGMAVWNFNGFNQTGVKDLNIFASTDGVNFTLVVGAPSQFAIGANAAAEPAELFSFSRTASFVRFDVLSAYGNFDFGLSEVMFTGSPSVPEPSGLALAANGTALLALLRRHRAKCDVSRRLKKTEFSILQDRKWE